MAWFPVVPHLAKILQGTQKSAGSLWVTFGRAIKGNELRLGMRHKKAHFGRIISLKPDVKLGGIYTFNSGFELLRKFYQNEVGK